MKKILAVVILFAMLTFILSSRVSVSADPQAIWPMFRYNAQNTGQSPYSTLNNGGGLKWKFNVSAWERIPVIGSDGTIYVGSNVFYALNPDGTLKWKYQGEDIVNPGFSTPAIGSDGTIYTGSLIYFYALNPDGTLKWKYKDDYHTSSPIIASDGTIYFETMSNGDLYALNADGTLKWKYRTGIAAYASPPAPSIGQDGTIYVGGVELNESQYSIFYLYAINPNGTLKWKYQVDDGIWAPAAISPDGTIYVGTFEGKFYAINNNGNLKWERNCGRIETCPAIAYDGTIYVGADYLYAFDRDGNQKWVYKEGGRAFCSPVISSEGIVYSMNWETVLYALKPNGTLIWKYKKGGNGVNDALSIGSDGTIYVVCSDIHALNGPAPLFNISASAGLGGTISPSGTITVNYGENKSFTITPDSGYKIADVKVGGSSVGAVSTYTFTNITAEHTIKATFEKNVTKTKVVLQIGNASFTVNGIPNTLDSPPIIKNSRTLLPIRAIVEALDGIVGWDGTEKKVTVTLGSTTIELWIGKSIAKVNGIDTPIDSTNSKVVPEIINGRTMIPLRFVTENLGCDVQWDGTTKTITIIYPAP